MKIETSEYFNKETYYKLAAMKELSFRTKNSLAAFCGWLEQADRIIYAVNQLTKFVLEWQPTMSLRRHGYFDISKVPSI
jgi:hypothetical protein